MKKIRLIPRLDIKGPNLVKGIHLEGLRVLGSPGSFAKHYYEQGADEIFYQDTVASLYGRNSLDQTITETARSIFVPLTVGGGIRSIEDIQRVLVAGADKVAINTAAIARPAFIRQASEVFGSSTIAVAIEFSRESDGRCLAYTDNGREFTGVDALEWAEQAAKHGAGEIILTSIDREGTKKGFDCEFIKEVTDRVDIPVIAHGGAGSVQDIQSLWEKAKPDGIAIASILHYGALQEGLTSASKATEGNTEFLRRTGSKAGSNRQTCSIPEIRTGLNAVGVPVRKR